MCGRYERRGDKQKIAEAFYAKGGLDEVDFGEDFATFTSEPNGIMQELHDRQPVILDPKDFQEWLSPSERLPVHLLRILPEDAIRAILLGDPVARAGEVVAYEGTI